MHPRVGRGPTLGPLLTRAPAAAAARGELVSASASAGVLTLLEGSVAAALGSVLVSALLWLTGIGRARTNARFRHLIQSFFARGTLGGTMAPCRLWLFEHRLLGFDSGVPLRHDWIILLTSFVAASDRSY